MKEAESSALPFRSNSSTWRGGAHRSAGISYQPPVLRLQQQLYLWANQSKVCSESVCVFTSFQTGFTSLSMLFVFCFSSKIQMTLREYWQISHKDKQTDTIVRKTGSMRTHRHWTINARIHLKPFSALLNGTLNENSTLDALYCQWNQATAACLFSRKTSQGGKTQPTTPVGPKSNDTSAMNSWNQAGLIGPFSHQGEEDTSF